MGEEPVMTRRRHRVTDERPLGPEDDPYLAYLIWREQRDAEAGLADGDPAAADGSGADAEVDATAPGRSGLRSLFGRLSARRHVNSGGVERDRSEPEAGAGAG